MYCRCKTIGNPWNQWKEYSLHTDSQWAMFKSSSGQKRGDFDLMQLQSLILSAGLKRNQFALSLLQWQQPSCMCPSLCLMGYRPPRCLEPSGSCCCWALSTVRSSPPGPRNLPPAAGGRDAGKDGEKNRGDTLYENMWIEEKERNR